MAGWKQLFSLLNSIKKESTSALNKFNAAQQFLLNAGKGKPDADELRDALVGSPLKKEIKSLKKLQGKLNKIVTPKVRMDEELPKMTHTIALKQISKKPWPEEALYEAERIKEQCDNAVRLLANRHVEITNFIVKSIPPGVTAKKAQANAKTLTAVMRKLMRIPKIGSICGPIWLDLEVSINPLVSGITRSFGLITRNYNKLNKNILKKMVEYSGISKSVQKVIKDAEKEVYK